MKKNCIILFSLIFLISSCILDEWDRRFIIINHSNARIYVDYSLDTVPVYPSKNYTQKIFDTSIVKGDSTFLTAGKPTWPKFIEHSKYKKITLFIFDADLLSEKINLDSLIDKKQYKSLIFNGEQLEKLNWHVTIED
ncbi:hypothetical protein [Pedobacter psychrodurus]|jgi:hypothetical protein|uniref:hypothetical protein n=1 Tax=Pedobacter psychrodurus TaxID=2530456 RepID=UPI00292FB8E7|nr:hypothetical protein [Pedobacter psychrodurus]